MPELLRSVSLFKTTKKAAPFEERLLGNGFANANQILQFVAVDLDQFRIELMIPPRIRRDEAGRPNPPLRPPRSNPPRDVDSQQQVEIGAATVTVPQVLQPVVIG